MRARSLLLLFLLAPASASAQPKTSSSLEQAAQSHIELATAAFQSGDFPRALAHLEAAYEADPQPDLLYAIAQVEQKLDRCTDAIAHYQQYLGTNPPAAARRDTEEAITVCESKLATQPVTPTGPYTPPQPLVAPASGAVTDGSADRGPSPWYADPLGLGLVGGGVILGALGVVVYTDARSDLDAAEVAVDHAEYQQFVDDAHGKRTASAVMIGGGIALVAGGVARLVLRDRGQERSSVALVPTRGGSVVTWGGSF